jgi:hypothetical protein
VPGKEEGPGKGPTNRGPRVPQTTEVAAYLGQARASIRALGLVPVGCVPANETTREGRTNRPLCDGHHILGDAPPLDAIELTGGGAIMRVHHPIAVAAAVLIGFGVKLFFFPAPIAEADAGGVKSSSLNVLQMHHKGLPVQKMSDMTFVFSDD